MKKLILLTPLLYSMSVHAFNLPPLLKHFCRLNEVCEKIDKIPESFIFDLTSSKDIRENIALAEWLNDNLSDHGYWNILLINNPGFFHYLHQYHHGFFCAIQNWVPYAPSIYLNIPCFVLIASLFPSTTAVLSSLLTSSPENYFALQIMTNIHHLVSLISESHDTLYSALFQHLQENIGSFSSVSEQLWNNCLFMFLPGLTEFFLTHPHTPELTQNLLMGLKYILKHHLLFATIVNQDQELTAQLFEELAANPENIESVVSSFFQYNNYQYTFITFEMKP